MQNFDIEQNILKKYTGTNQKVVVPEGILKIDSWACSEAVPDACHPITDIELPKSLLYIGKSAFRD